ncbi:hypothetical protein GCM10011579_063870 [Streptomyces albiflavescens]|uniref:Uncharacterized protein n=1 Tax=Streptomyces albiflavescens TaxID=1623582 RepID=A0A918D771_9ACTN|nr:hypothetical protein [Streptomyces albiflavescens]GGN79420.1 hypothetical protein GCM10011579_063870 [Streptomyces albiflavescens]
MNIGVCVKHVPTKVTVRQKQPSIAYRSLADRSDIVELSLVSRDGAYEPLVREFLRIAAAGPQPAP